MKKIFFGLSVLILMVMVYPKDSSAQLTFPTPTLKATLEEVSTETVVADGNTTSSEEMVSTFKVSLTSDIWGDVYVGLGGFTANPLVLPTSFEIKDSSGAIPNVSAGTWYNPQIATISPTIKIPRCTLVSATVTTCTPVVFYIRHTFPTSGDDSYQVTLKKLGWTTSLSSSATQKYTYVDFKTPVAEAVSSIQVITPNGGEILAIGSTYEVANTYDTPFTPMIGWALYKGQTKLGSIEGDVVLSDQKLRWNVGKYRESGTEIIKTASPGTDYYIGLYTPGNSQLDFSDAPFTLTSSAPSISNVKVNGLNSGKWTRGQFKTITWDSVGLDKNLEIGICSSSNFCTALWNNVVNDGIQRLQLPTDLNSGQHIGSGFYVTVAESFGGVGKSLGISASSPTFTINPAPLEETQTASNRIGGVAVDGLVGNSWFKDQTKIIKWNQATAGTSTVDIILCQDHPFYNCWPTMEMKTANDGSQPVKVWHDTGSATNLFNDVYAKVRSVGTTIKYVGISTTFSVIAPISGVEVAGIRGTENDPNYNTWTKGQTKTVHWSNPDLTIPTVDIFICKAGTGINLSKPDERCRATMNGMVISTNTINDGTENIKIPNDPNYFTPGTDYEIFIRKLNSPSMGASSTDRFRIIAPVSVGVGQANPNDSALANVLSSLQSLLTQLSGLLKR